MALQCLALQLRLPLALDLAVEAGGTGSGAKAGGRGVAGSREGFELPWPYASWPIAASLRPGRSFEIVRDADGRERLHE